MYQVSIQRDDREGREDREEVEVDKGDLEVQQNPPVAKRTWLQTAAAAGVLAMVTWTLFFFQGYSYTTLGPLH